MQWVTLNSTICWNSSTPSFFKNQIKGKNTRVLNQHWIYGKISQLEPISRKLFVKQKPKTRIVGVFYAGRLPLFSNEKKKSKGQNSILFIPQVLIKLCLGFYLPKLDLSGRPHLVNLTPKNEALVMIAPHLNKLSSAILTSTGSSETTRGAFLTFFLFLFIILNITFGSQIGALFLSILTSTEEKRLVFFAYWVVFLASSKQQGGSKKSPYCFASYNGVKPQHKTSLPVEFLEWFIGFSEGYGSFGKKDGLPSFVMNQADLKVLYLIRATLGFGTVSTFDQEGRKYGRLTISNKENTYRLITIFNGNIHLSKVHTRFAKWVGLYNRVYNKNVTVLPPLPAQTISLDTAWLSGFIEAEGCFYAGFSENDRMAQGVRLRLKVSVDQKGESPILEQIKVLFLVKNVTIRNAEKNYLRVEATRIKPLTVFLQYFSTYKLKGRKQKAYAVWARLVCRYLNHTHLLLTREDIVKKTNRVNAFNQAFKEEKNVITLLQKEFEQNV
jgi:hypothetical protein